MNDPVIEITLTKNSEFRRLPQIEVYRTESGEYFFRDVEIVTKAIASCLNRLDSMEFASVLIAVKVFSMSERERRI